MEGFLALVQRITKRKLEGSLGGARPSAITVVRAACSLEKQHSGVVADSSDVAAFPKFPEEPQKRLALTTIDAPGAEQPSDANCSVQFPI
ncbi:MAG TPA: hypothetical protein VJO52_02440 [Gemmatimonadaceae bacterium]|nr:hypothetical protein [Gemmatimonadaceae bacterium]